jgi:hypothetical protein
MAPAYRIEIALPAHRTSGGIDYAAGYVDTGTRHV